MSPFRLPRFRRLALALLCLPAAAAAELDPRAVWEGWQAALAAEGYTLTAAEAAGTGAALALTDVLVKGPGGGGTVLTLAVDRLDLAPSGASAIDVVIPPGQSAAFTRLGGERPGTELSVALDRGPLTVTVPEAAKDAGRAPGARCRPVAPVRPGLRGGAGTRCFSAAARHRRACASMPPASAARSCAAKPPASKPCLSS